MKFQLNIRIPFEELDDVAARKKANEMLHDPSGSLSNLLIDVPDSVTKLQRLVDGGQPVGVPLTTSAEPVPVQLDNKFDVIAAAPETATDLCQRQC